MYDQPVKIGEGGRIVLLTRDQAVNFVQERMAAYTPKGRLLSEELIQERQKEADHD